MLAALCGTQDPSSLTRGRTHTPCNGSTESEPLGHQDIARSYFLKGSFLDNLSISFPVSFPRLCLKLWDGRTLSSQSPQPC